MLTLELEPPPPPPTIDMDMFLNIPSEREAVLGLLLGSFVLFSFSLMDKEHKIFSLFCKPLAISIALIFIELGENTL